jgi:thioredoxin reductase
MIEKEVVVIGGGPSGLSVAIEVAKRGAEVLVVDENLRAGGQLFKQIHKFFGSSAHQAGVRGIDIASELLEQARECGVEVWLNSVVVGLFKEKKVTIKKRLADNSEKLEIIQAKKIVIATGASENAVRFKGWTLPGVMGAGAAQTMINVNRVLPGKRILMIGSGNVGLIVSYQLLQAGAEVVAVIEAAPQIGGYGVHAAKIRRAGVPVYTSHTIQEARGKKSVEKAVICEVNDKWQPIRGTEKILKVDTITIAAGLKPLIELAMMHDCKCSFFPQLGGWVPLHDENMESTNPGIYLVGDVTGVEEANTALEEGRLAGTAIAEALKYISLEDAGKLKKEIWQRLNELRMGPFGEAMMLAKNNILTSCKIIKNFG